MKHILTVLLIMTSLSSCTNTNKELNAATKHNMEVVNKMFDHFNKHEWDKMSEVYSEDALFLDPSLGTEYVPQTRKEIAAKYLELAQFMPDLQDSIVSMYAVDDKVFVEFIAHGTTPEGPFKLPIAAVLTVSGNHIIKDASYYNNAQ